MEKEILEISSFTIAPSKQTKPTKDVRPIQMNPLIHLQRKKFKDENRRWKDLPCSQVGKISNLKMTVLTKMIYTFNAVSAKTTYLFFLQKHKIK